MGVESPAVVAVEEVEVEEVLETLAGMEVKQSIELVCQAMYQARETVTTSAHILLQLDLSSSAMHEIQVINNFHDNQQCPHWQKCHVGPSSHYCRLCQPCHASKREKNHAISHVCNPNHLDNMQRSQNALPRPTD